MKKIYESPIVEITVFDVEDVITTSAGGGVTSVDTITWTADDVAGDAKSYAAKVGADTVGHYNSYTW